MITLPTQAGAMYGYQQQGFYQGGGYSQTPDPNLLAQFENIAKAALGYFSEQRMIIDQNHLSKTVEILNNQSASVTLQYQRSLSTTAYDQNSFQSYVFQCVKNAIDVAQAELARMGMYANPGMGYQTPPPPTAHMNYNPNSMMSYYKSDPNTISNIKQAPAAFLNKVNDNKTIISNTPTNIISPTIGIPQQKPKIQEQETVVSESVSTTEGSFETPVVALTHVGPTDEDKTKMELYTTTDKSIQECLNISKFCDPDNNTICNFAHFRLNIPYSSSNYAIEDLYNAYPELFDNDVPHFMHLIEFNQMLPFNEPYDEFSLILDRIKEAVTTNPYNITEAIKLIDNPISRYLYTSDMVRIFNNLSSVYLANVKPNKKPNSLVIEDLSDISEIISDTNTGFIQEIKNIPNFNKTLEFIVKTMCDTYFHFKNTDREPYVNVETEERIYAIRHESSGIRVGRCSGRDYDEVNEENDVVIESVTKKIKARTLVLKKRSILCTNMDLPNYQNILKNDTDFVSRATDPIHFVLSYVLSQPIKLYELDLRISGCKDAVVTGISNKNMLFSLK